MNSTVPENASAAVVAGTYFNPAIDGAVVRACPAGQYGVNGSGVSLEQACFLCPAGYFCDVGATDVAGGVPYTVCPTGHFCLGGTVFAVQYPCPAGTFNNATGRTSEEACTPCPEVW